MKVFFNNFFLELYFLECSRALGLGCGDRLGERLRDRKLLGPYLAVQAKVLVPGRGKNQVDNSFFFFFNLGPCLQHMKVPRLGGESEL